MNPMEKIAVPEQPIPFGYKISWLCIQSEEPQTVMSALGLNGVPCGWTAGLERAGEDGAVFVSPVLDGFVLVIGWMTEDLDELTALTENVPSLQYYASHRMVDYYAWASFRAGELFRAYAYSGEEDEVLWDKGTLTAEEIALGGERFQRQDEEPDWDSVEYPDEETVLSLAAAWGIDPAFSEKQYPAALGWLCEREKHTGGL